jgi:acyl-CoA hydrolase
MIEQTKTVEDSKTIQMQLIMAEDINGYGRLFGGRLMEWIDLVGGATARRHANRNITTAVVDNLEFLAPAYLGELIVLIGRITYVGSSSMEVRVDAFIEHLDGSRDLVNRAYLVYVALDEGNKPIRVPRLLRSNEEEESEWNDGLLRRQQRDTRRSQKMP